MRSKHCLLLIFCVISMVTVKSQSPAPNDMPIIVPPSPELASLAKIGTFSTGLHTGSANVNIPLYEITNGGVKLPVALSYSTNGIRVNDIAGRVGLGWNLVAGGVVTRTIHDEDDFSPYAPYLPLPSSLEPTENNSGLYYYLVEANFENKDTEKDEYSFSVNGMSGNFFIDNNGVPRLANHSNFKMEVSSNGNVFLLTDANGIKYYFGENGANEKTRGYLLNGTGRWDRISQTGWFLTRIVTPENAVIQFNYLPIFIKTLRGPSQNMVVKPNGTGTGTGLPCPECDPICEGAWKYPAMNRVDYDTKYLSSITTSNGCQVYFVYETRADAGGDNRLKEILIQQTVSNIAYPLKNYVFEYEDRAISADWNKRFYLKNLLTQSPDNPTLIHQFEYNDPGGLPSQHSYDQDYYGYANNSGNYNSNFAPKPSYYASLPQGTLLANRAPNYAFMQKGVLKKVTYPTGGSEEFNYEQHTVPELVTDSAFLTNHRSGTGLNNPLSPNIISFNFNTNSIGIVNVQLSAEQNPDGPFPGDPGHWYPGDGHPLVEFVVRRASDNVQLSSTKLIIYNSINFNLNLPVNTAYRGELKVYGRSTLGIVDIKYSPTITSHWQNTPACGLRVNSIASYDPVSNKTTKRFYKYANPNDLSVSSGKGIPVPLFSRFYPSGGICVGACDYPLGSIQIECNNNVQISSSSITNLPNFSGSSVAYTDVIESDDINFINGATQHTFYTELDLGIPNAIFGHVISNAPVGVHADMNGLETKTTYLKKSGNQFIVLKRIINTYNVDNRIFYEVKNYVHRQRWQPYLFENTMFTFETKIKPFDMNMYSHSSTWFHLDETVVTEFDPNGANPVVNTTTYTYGNTEHTSPTLITTTDSKGQPVVQENKYPADYNAAPYTTMVAKHIITPVIENKTIINNNLISTVKVDYKDWFNDGSVLKPWVVNMQKGNIPGEARLRYHAMDASGNVTEVSKENGTRVSYVWDYLKTMPVAEVKNASVTDIAYCSFETDNGTGNWTVLGTPLPPGNTDLNNHWTIYPTEGMMGKRSFGGKLSKTINPATDYTVTLWSKATAAPTANTVAGTLVHTKGNWKLYTWTISSTGTLIIQGNQFDDIRLHPTTAQMTSYTYQPYIGLDAVADAANNIQYYEYDGLNRLLRVRDIDKNILKQYDYQYNQPIANCPTNQQWIPTGITQCVMDANNNYTGVKKKQERDENNCSSTYLQTRWVNIDHPIPHPDCVPLPGCTGPDKRWVGTPPVCETGVKVLVSSWFRNNLYTCIYKYVWSDGYEGPNFIETGTNPCTGIAF